MTWAIVLHGGAKDIPPGKEAPNRAGMLEALAAGRVVLSRGGSAVEALEAALRVLEADKTFNAGYGSAPTSDDQVEMDAGLMDGATLDVGAVGALKGVRHPVTVARLMLREKPTLLVGQGARRFAEARGLEVVDAPEALADPNPLALGKRKDTVGGVALDSAGHLAAATSTGGLPDSHPGRVGDSPLPGCGFYAEDGLGAVSFSGDGESIARLMLAGRIMHGLERHSPEQAVKDALALLDRVGGEAGAIVLDGDGRIGWAHKSPHFAVAYASSEAEPRVYLRKEDESVGPSK